MGLTLINAPVPARSYPNMNVMMGIRGMWRFGGPGLGLIAGSAKGKFVPIGTIPAGSFVHSSVLHCSALLGAGFTFDIGGNPDTASPPVPAYDFGTGITVAAAAWKPQTLTFGFVPVDVEVYLRLNGAGQPAAGAVDVIIQFYTQRN
jgi:hypothetical protein